MAKKRTRDGVTLTRNNGVVQLTEAPVYNLRIDRTRHDVSDWRDALQSAESVINPTRRRLYDIYAQVVLDPHLSTVMDKRQLAILNAGLKFVDAQGEEVEEVRTWMRTQAFEEMLKHIHDSRYYGYSLFKFRPDITNECELVDRRHVKPEWGIVTYMPSDMTGVSYVEEPYDRLYVGVGGKKDLGLLLKAAPWVILKNGDVSDWAQYNEIFGMPTRVGYYDPNNPSTRLALVQALSEAGSNQTLVIPEGSKLELSTANFSGTGSKTYNDLAEYVDEQLSKLFLGNTLTTDQGGNGSRALGDVHAGIEAKIARADRTFVLRILESRIKPLLELWGFPVQGGEFQWIEEEETLTITEQLDNDLKIHSEVGRLPKQYFKENYGVEFVDDSDEVEQPEQPEPPVPPAEDKATAEPEPKAKTGKQDNAAPGGDPPGFWPAFFDRFFGVAPAPSH